MCAVEGYESQVVQGRAVSEFIWVNDNIRLGDIDPWEYNPRLSTKKQAERIVQSHNDFGQVDVFAVGPRNEAGKYPLYNGHQRHSAWLAEFGPDYMVDVRRCSRELTTEERQALTGYLHSGAVGSWNWDILPSIDQDILGGVFCLRR